MKNKLLNTLTAVILLLMPNINFGQAPNLNTLKDYAIFTKTGAVTGSGATYLNHITGHVGTNSASPTGFGNVDGILTIAGDSRSMQADIDVVAAYNQLVGTTPTDITHGPLLGAPGAGEILFAGVYAISNANITIDQNLVLDAQNDPTKVFIFQLDGDVATTANTKVKLINGALACNVFWQVSLTMGMATGTSFKGTIVAGGQIDMVALDTLEGRALTKVGAINVTQDLIYIPTGCNSTVHNGPIAPSLASAACYTIFSVAGALTNTVATSTSIGDVGNNGIGAITGWAQGDVTGILHLTQDPSTIACAVDVSNAYSALLAFVPDIELLAPTELGHGLVLTPHIYHMGAAAHITDSIILNGEGNANAVFVIQIEGNLTTETYAEIKLINGTQSQNVFWVVSAGGFVAINNYDVFRGTIICENAINMVNTAVQLDGRAFSMTGAIVTEGLTAIMPPGCGSSPIVVTDPINDTVCFGDTASFSVIATGTNLTYQWMDGNTPLVNGGNISGADSATLYIYPTSFSDTSSFYNVIVNGSLLPSDTSIYVSLTVNTAPVIIMEPTDQVPCIGSAASFSVVATGSGLTYQWRRGNINLSDIGNIVGSDSTTLVISNVSLLDTAFNYNVVVSGTCSPNDISVNVSLNVNPSPVIIMQPSTQTVCEGDSTGFIVVATGTALTYQWRKGLTNIFGETNDTLTIDPANISDVASNYNVVITGSCSPSVTSLSVSLNVNTAPTITLQPVDTTVCAGDTVRFTVAATGTGLTYQWRKGLVNLSNIGNISGADSTILTISGAMVTDSASNYNVVVTGTCSPNATSMNVSLTVNPIPVAVASSNSPICEGSSLSMTAQTLAGATYSWSGPNGYNSSAQDSVMLSATVANSGTYTLTVTKNGCSDTATTIVAVNVCFTDLSIVKTASNMSPFIGKTIVFTIVATNGGTDNGTGVEVTDILQSGYTYVSSTTTDGTYDPSTGVWTIDSLNNGASETLTVTVTVNADGNYVNTAIIYGTETDLNMANNVSSIEPIPTDFFLPEGFSPNGDGINDVFVIRGILNFPENTFVIFNRWGNKVYETSSYKNTWDGKTTLGLRVGGDSLPIGTYFYILDLKDGSDVFKGTIYLNR